MLVPKHKVSKSRGRKRRTFYKIEAVNPAVCKQCGSPKRAHMICPSCGYYHDRQVLSVSAEK